MYFKVSICLFSPSGPLWSILSLDEPIPCPTDMERIVETIASSVRFSVEGLRFVDLVVISDEESRLWFSVETETDTEWRSLREIREESLPASFATILEARKSTYEYLG